jgi:hypothetical protein
MSTARPLSPACRPAGAAGLFGTFWYDAWHTDLGRDQATIPPHLLLYASMATIGAVITITADSANDCAALPPRRLLVRRAGQTVTGRLTATGHCRYAGQVGVPAIGRWFVHVEQRPPGFEVEAWLPVDASSANPLVEHRQLYLPAGRTQGARLPGSEVAAGSVLYALGAPLLALIIRQVRGPARTHPVPHAARTCGAATHGGGVGHRRTPAGLGP